jgi:hypothetical protein
VYVRYVSFISFVIITWHDIRIWKGFFSQFLPTGTCSCIYLGSMRSLYKINSVKISKSQYNFIFAEGKGKAIPTTGRRGPQGWETSSLPHFLDNRLTDGGEIFSLTRRPNAFYPPGRFLVLISIRGSVDRRALVRLEGLDQLKNLMTSSRMEPVTFQLAA